MHTCKRTSVQQEWRWWKCSLATGRTYFLTFFFKMLLTFCEELLSLWATMIWNIESFHALAHFIFIELFMRRLSSLHLPNVASLCTWKALWICLHRWSFLFEKGPRKRPPTPAAIASSSTTRRSIKPFFACVFIYTKRLHYTSQGCNDQWLQF